MTDSRPTQASCPPRLPQRVKERPHPWLPGELLVGVTVVVPPGTDPGTVVSMVRDSVAKILGDIPVERPDDESDPPLLIPAREGERDLLFVHFRLGSPEPRVMRLAIARLNNAGPDGAFGKDVELVAATPNWFGAAQQAAEGGSPASYPVPAEPFGSRVRYAPQLERLDLVHEASRREHDAVQVAVLDAVPRLADLEWARDQFPHNRHLHELLDKLVAPIGALPASPLETARHVALQTLDAGGFHPVEWVAPIDVRDHGLFVAGVVHASAPWARIRLVRVLNDFGIGSLHALIVALVGLLQIKRADDRLVINLSLGMLPALEQLAYIWFGFPIPGLPGCPPDQSLQFLPGEPDVSPAELLERIKRHDPEIESTVNRLHQPLSQLMQLLEAQNCMIVAAAGNDSVYRGGDRTPRWDPRLPARYDSVLGVAAAVRPGVPARYSNRGELTAAVVRDAVATLGGDLAADGVTPTGGVLGVYSAEQFPALPSGGPPALNDTGWAEWSGTSFAAPIMAGVAANVWAVRPDLSSSNVLDTINDAAREGGRPDVTDLGVPGVPVRLTWLP